MNKIVKLTGIILCGLLLQACDKAQLNPIPHDASILAFGDSLTYGKGVEEEQSYPSILAQLSNRDVINAGISGETTQEGLARIEEVLEDTQPNLMILLEGGNDILRNHNLNNTKQNLASMIEIAQSFGVQVVLIGVPEKKLFSNSAKIFPELAKQYGLVFEGELIASLLRSPKYKSDSVHFNELGYQKMAQSIFELLQKQEAL
jgi:lysophospholipase L1-like esterase